MSDEIIIAAKKIEMKKKNIAVLIALVATIISAMFAGCIQTQETSSSVPTQKIDSESNGLKSSMLTPRMGTASSNIDGNIYIFGGMTQNGRSTAIVEAYDSSKDKWTTKKSMPTPRFNAYAVVIDNKIYVIGGRNEITGVLNTVEVYNTVNNNWETIQPMKFSRWNLFASVVGGKIYVIGGIAGVGENRESIDKVEIYDPVKNSWSTGSSLPIPKQGASIAVLKEKIYVLGGRAGAGDNGYATNIVEVYDPFKDTWSSAKPMHKERTGAQASVVDSIIYMVGGASETELVDLIETYNPDTNDWTIEDFSLQKPRTGHSVASIGTKIYIIGGATEMSLAGITGIVEEIVIDKQKGEKDIDVLIESLINGDEKVRKDAYNALGNIGEPAVEPLIQALKVKERDVNTKGYIAIALGKIGDSRAIEPLIQALKEEVDVNMKGYFSIALGMIGKPAVEPLIQAMKDTNNFDPYDRLSAALALGYIGKSAVEPLIQVLNDDDNTNRYSAAVALGNIGDSRAIEPLKKALNDEDYRVREKAKEALEKISK